MLIPMQPQDYELIMAWRSDPEIYQGFFTQSKPLTWEEHIAWLGSRRNWWELIIWYNGRRVGIVTVGQLDHWNPEIGYFVGEKSLWGKGIGKQAVSEVLEHLKGIGKTHCHTTVLKDNERSLRLLKSLGFTESMEAREGEVWLTREL